MEKIKSITLRNFKFFYGDESIYEQNKIVLNGENLLLYGENGSGKSSIYWALYTFLQSSLKINQHEIEKYFDPINSENLRNRFSDTNDESGIIVEFQSGTGDFIKNLRRNSDSSYELNCFNDSTIKSVLEGSDFINYKFLSKIYDFRNSEAINLFSMFERDLLMFINFEEAYYEHNGHLSNKTYASDWWKFIIDAPNQLPYSTNKVRVGSDEYKRFKNTTIRRFVELLKSFLADISLEVNRLLLEDFEEKFTIDFDLDKIECDYNKSISQKAKDGKIHKPKIPLKVKFDHVSLSEVNKEILKPHTFLNEARLTAIALAIRLAILNTRPVFQNTARILVLDDLLLSLDMSHRDKVLDIILSKSFTDTYQIMILTHDRAFYHLCKKRVDYRYPKGWVFKEVYQHETETGIPCPFIPDQKNYLDLAKKYLKEFDYPASANYLRKEAERVLKNLLPENLTIYTADEGSKILQLDSLISNFEKYYRDLGGDITPFSKFKEHKDLLLNPLSHDNIHSPVYRNELLNVMSLLTNLNKLEVKTLGIVDPDDANLFHLREADSSGDDWEYAFTLKENWRAIKGLDDVWRFSNPLVKVLSRMNISQNLPSENIDKLPNKLSQAYTNVRFSLRIRVKQADDSYIDSIKKYNEIVYLNDNLILN